MESNISISLLTSTKILQIFKLKLNH